jgi:uncharacterized protein YidB (DUF937 family)
MGENQLDIGGILGGLLKGQGGSSIAKLLPAVMGMVGGKGGGIGSLLSKLQEGGLGDQTKSWVDPGASNAPVTSQQVTEALGDHQINDLATQAGVSPQQAAEGLAQILPTTVDKLTPDGQVPTEPPKFDVNQLQEQVSKLINH